MSAPARVSVLVGERRWWLVAIVLVTVAAGVLRLVELGSVPEDLYYHAAVKAMTLSLHNFLFGAFDPSATTSIDKPPIDLWLQVIAVKLFGFGPVTLKLPEALAGTAAIPLLFDLVRRVAGPLAALASAITLTFLPTSVVTARSDTMDSVMMLLLVVVAGPVLGVRDLPRQPTTSRLKHPSGGKPPAIARNPRPRPVRGQGARGALRVTTSEGQYDRPRPTRLWGSTGRGWPPTAR